MNEIEIEARQVHLQEQAKQIAITGQLVGLALRALSERLLTLIALMLDAGLFGWAMYAGTWERIAAAVLFSVATWFLIKVTPVRGSPHET